MNTLSVTNLVIAIIIFFLYYMGGFEIAVLTALIVVLGFVSEIHHRDSK